MTPRNNELFTEIEALIEEYRQASESFINSASDSTMWELKRRRVQLEDEILQKWSYLTQRKDKEALTPFCYIIVSNREEVRLHLEEYSDDLEYELDEKLFEQLHPERYGEKSLDHWRPFEDKKMIKEYLQDEYGPLFKTVYLNGKLSKQGKERIWKSQEESLVIVDVFSLNKYNGPLCSSIHAMPYTDLLAPICSTTNDNTDLEDYVDEMKERHFPFYRIKLNSAERRVTRRDIRMFTDEKEEFKMMIRKAYNHILRTVKRSLGHRDLDPGLTKIQ